MNDRKKDTKALKKMDVKGLMINTRMNVEKARQEAKSSLARSKENSREISDIIIAIDGINTHLKKRVSQLESLLSRTLSVVEYMQKPWYSKLWNRIICSLMKLKNYLLKK